MRDATRERESESESAKQEVRSRACSISVTVVNPHSYQITVKWYGGRVKYQKPAMALWSLDRSWLRSISLRKQSSKKRTARPFATETTFDFLKNTQTLACTQLLRSGRCFLCWWGSLASDFRVSSSSVISDRTRHSHTVTVTGNSFTHSHFTRHRRRFLRRRLFGHQRLTTPSGSIRRAHGTTLASSQVKFYTFTHVPSPTRLESLEYKRKLTWQLH